MAKKTLEAFPPEGTVPLAFRSSPPALPESGSIPQQKLNPALASYPAEPPEGVYEIASRRFNMPLRCDKLDPQAKAETIRLFVSEDQGKNWKHKKDYKSNDKLATFTALVMANTGSHSRSC